MHKYHVKIPNSFFSDCKTAFYNREFGARLSPLAKIFDSSKLPSARVLALLVWEVFFRRHSLQKNGFDYKKRWGDCKTAFYDRDQISQRRERQESTNMGADSQRRMRLPSPTEQSPAFCSISTSFWQIPPSLPTKNAMVLGLSL